MRAGRSSEGVQVSGSRFRCLFMSPGGPFKNRCSRFIPVSEISFNWSGVELRHLSIHIHICVCTCKCVYSHVVSVYACVCVRTETLVCVHLR